MKLACSSDAIKILINGIEISTFTSLHDGTYNNIVAPQFKEYSWLVPGVNSGDRWPYVSIKEFKWLFGNIYFIIAN